MTFLIVIFIIMSVLLLFSKVLQKYYVPSIVSMMLVGILLGPNALNFIERALVLLNRTDKLVQVNSTLEIFNLLGIIFVMNLAGLEMDLSIIKREKRGISYLSVLTTVIPAVTGALVAMYLKLNAAGILLFASLFASHSIGLIFSTIKELKIEKTVFGITVMGATIVTDVISIIILSITILWQQHNLGGDRANWYSLFNLFGPDTNKYALTAYFVLGMVLYFWISLALAPKLLNFLGSRMRSVTLHSPLFFLCMILLFIIIGEILGINLVIGAFVAGVAISFSGLFTTYHDMEEILTKIGYGIFVPFMFFYIGMETNISSLFNITNIIATLVICVALVVSKMGSGYAAMKLAGHDTTRSVLGGLMTIPQLTATLAAANIALAMRMINEEIFTSIVILSIVTSIPIPILCKYIIEKWKPDFKYTDIETQEHEEDMMII